MRITVTESPLYERKFAKDMSVGEIGRVCPTGSGYDGEVALRVYEYLISLTNPSNTWSLLGANCLEVDILPAGSKVILEVKGEW